MNYQNLINDLRSRESKVYWSDDPDPFYMPDMVSNQAASVIENLSNKLEKAVELLKKVDDPEVVSFLENL